MAKHSIPHLARTGSVTQLVVEGRPFLVLGGELGNSSASNLVGLDQMFAKLRSMNLNTVMLPVYWDLVERTEGVYDFNLVMGALDLARRHGLKVVYLWFGTWKNSMSCYAPRWVKRDTKRFPRVETLGGEVLEMVSPFCRECQAKDAAAFRALMRWTRDFEEGQQTVVMAQVGNEVGCIPEARDFSAAAETAYRSTVPEELTKRLVLAELGPEVQGLWEAAGRQESTSWDEMFGDSAEGQEVFTAWFTAKYVEGVARAGKSAYPIPMLANAALIRPGYRPGQYPSGGPLPHLIEVWQTAAPSLDILSPDVYFPEFWDWAARYRRSGNPVFAPEIAPSLRAAANALYGIGELGAIGVGPFAIEDFEGEKQSSMTGCYGILRRMMKVVFEAQGTGKVRGLTPKVRFDWSVVEEAEEVVMGGVLFHAKFDRSVESGAVGEEELPTLGVGRWECPAGVPLGAVMIVQVGDEEFYVVGRGVTLTFAPEDGRGKVGIEDVQEGDFDESGRWKVKRWLNGDQTHQGRHVRLPEERWSVQRVKLYRY